MSPIGFDDPHDWATVHRRRTGTPPNDQAALEHWIHTQYVPTQHERDLDQALDRLLSMHVGLTKRWLAVDGEATIGKSHTVTALCLRRAMQHPLAWYERTASGFLHVPYIYVEATSSSTRGLLRSVAEFCGIPGTGSEEDLLRRLKSTLPLLGTVAVIVDEAQMFRRKSAGASTVTDNLRSILKLPVAFVFVGINLGDSALLRDWGINNDTVRQLRRRHDMVPLTRLSGPSGVTEILRIVRAFGKRLLDIDGVSLTGLHDAEVLRQLAICGEGRPGTMLETLKHAAVLAVQADGDVSAERITECLPEPPESPVLGGGAP